MDVSEVSQPKKKAKLSAELKVADESLSTSPDLPHKLPTRMRKGQDEDSDDDDDDSDERGEKSNLF